MQTSACPLRGNPEFGDLVYVVMALTSIYQEALSASHKLAA